MPFKSEVKPKHRPKVKPFFESKYFVSNPFVHDTFRLSVRQYKDGSWLTTQEKNGKSRINRLKVMEVEQERYTRVFNQAANREVFAALSPDACKLLLWIIADIKPSHDWIWINVQRYMSEAMIKDIRTYKAQIEELSRYGFITPHHKYKETYWTNPRYFFCGSRILKYPSSVELFNPKNRKKPKPTLPAWQDKENRGYKQKLPAANETNDKQEGDSSPYTVQT